MDENTDGESTESGSTDNGASVVLNLEGLIKNHISSIDQLQDELTKHADMLNDIFENNPVYKAHMEKVKEVTKIKNATKQEILKQPDAAELSNKVKSMKSEIKELQGALSDYLKEFLRLSGLNEIEGEDGEIREIITVPRLVKKMSGAGY